MTLEEVLDPLFKELAMTEENDCWNCAVVIDMTEKYTVTTSSQMSLHADIT